MIVEENEIELLKRLQTMEKTFDYIVSELSRLNDNLEKIFEMGNNLIPK